MPEQRCDEQQLFRERSRDPAARDALIGRYLPLARSLARRYARGAEPVEDLEQVAALALISAIDMFEAELGVAFSSYAVPTIAAALKRHYREVGWTVRPPRHLQQLALDVRQAYTAMHSESLDRPRKLGDSEAAPLIETIGDRDGEIRRAFERVTL